MHETPKKNVVVAHSTSECQRHFTELHDDGVNSAKYFRMRYEDQRKNAKIQKHRNGNALMRHMLLNRSILLLTWACNSKNIYH